MSTNTDWNELTGFKRDILEAVARLENDNQTPYGLGIKRELETYYGEEVNHGRLYPNLDDLVGEGLLEKSELDKRTNRYGLTEDGRGLLRAYARRAASAARLHVTATDGGDA